MECWLTTGAEVEAGAAPTAGGKGCEGMQRSIWKVNQMKVMSLMCPRSSFIGLWGIIGVDDSEEHVKGKGK